MAIYTIAWESLNLDNGLEYKSDKFSDLLKALNVPEGADLQITNASKGQDPDDGDNFYVKGAIQLFSLCPDSDIEIELYLDFTTNEYFEFQLNATLPQISLKIFQDTRLLPSNPLTEVAAFFDLPFKDVKLVFDSERSELYYGMLEDEDSDSETAAISLLKPIGLSFKNFGFELLRTYSTNKLTCFLLVDLVFGKGDNVMELDVKLGIPWGGIIPAKCWTLELTNSVDLTKGIVSLFDFIAETAGFKSVHEQGDGPATNSLFGDTSIGKDFHDQLNKLPSVYLENLRVLFDPLSPKLNLITFQLHCFQPLTILKDFLTIEEIGLKGIVHFYNGKKSFGLTLFGVLDITEDITMDISLDIPDNNDEDWVFLMGASVDIDSILHLDNLPTSTEYDHYKLPENFKDVNDLRIERFEVALNPVNQTVTSIIFDLKVNMDIMITHNFGLQNPSLYFKVINPFNQTDVEEPRSLTGEIASGIVIGDIVFNISAEKKEDGWIFTGETAPGRVEMGKFITVLADHFGIGDPPGFIRDMVLEKLKLTFETIATESEAEEGDVKKSSQLTFECDAKFPIDHEEGKKIEERDSVDIKIKIDLEKEGEKQYKKAYSGEIIIKTERTGELKFNIKFFDEKTKVQVTNTFTATYSHSNDQAKLHLGHLIRSILKSQSRSPLLDIADTIEFDLKDALFAYTKTEGGGKKFVFGFDIGAQISLSSLPLVGQEFPEDQKMGVENLQILYAGHELEKDEISAINKLIPDGVSKLPEPAEDKDKAEGGASATETEAAETQKLSAGIHASAILKLGDATRTLTLPVSGEDGGKQPATRSVSVVPEPAAPAAQKQEALVSKWFKVQKSVGPVHFERVGFQYKDSAVWFMLDAALSFAGLTISLDGLALGSPLDHFAPRFDLHGLGLDFKKGPLEIGGAFLRETYTTTIDGVEVRYDEYEGTALIRTEQLMLSAIGAYAYVDGHPSLFLYAVLDYPLGGPAFFFVEGLTAGFGYNRALVIPEIEDLETYPLVAQAMNLGKGGKEVVSTETLKEVRNLFPISTGDYFLAVGVKFNSFRMLDSFALLAVRFGNTFEVDLLGMSSLVVPKQKAGGTIPPLAKGKLVLSARFLPEKGFLGVLAQLTKDSYVLSPDCHLTGGFAFYSWFKDDKEQGIEAGDFALTLGGYHALYNPPKHYPRVPPLGFNWQVTDELLIKGDAYFALTASALMAGGHLEATWHSGHLKAWFNVGADFIISWQPYYYDARMYVHIGGSYTFKFFGWHTISLELGADLHLWGPPFSGIARVHYYIVSFEVSFGGAAQAPKPIDWNTFRASFLPEGNQFCSVSVNNGLVRQEKYTHEGKEEELWVINPKHFSLVTNSVIPCSLITLGTRSESGKAFGIGSMEIKSIDSSPPESTQKIELKQWDGTQWISYEKNKIDELFEVKKIEKNVPAALWGDTLKPDIQGAQFIKNRLTGIEILPKEKPPELKNFVSVNREVLQGMPDHAGDYRWVSEKNFEKVAQVADVKTSVANTAVVRKGLFNDFPEFENFLGGETDSVGALLDGNFLALKETT